MVNQKFDEEDYQSLLEILEALGPKEADLLDNKRMLSRYYDEVLKQWIQSRTPIWIEKNPALLETNKAVMLNFLKRKRQRRSEGDLLFDGGSRKKTSRASYRGSRGGANRHLLKEESCNERQQGALEGAGLTLEYFNIWKSSLIESLHQNHESFKHFLPGGLYSCWVQYNLAESGQRLLQLHLEDPLQQVQNADTAVKTEETDINPALTLSQRNSELDYFIQTICDLINVPSVEQTIRQFSTCFEDIMQVLIDHYKLSDKKVNLLQISDIKYVPNEDLNAFYVRIRSAVCSNLKKKGDKVRSYDDIVFAEDEILSPTFEDFIVVWCLEKIDSKLPSEVYKTFATQLSGDHTLKDLQEEIFQYIPVVLEHNEVTEDYYIPDDSNHVKKEDASATAAIQSFHDFDAINDDFEPFHDTKEDMVDKKDPEWAPVDVKENKPPIVRRSTKTQKLKTVTKKDPSKKNYPSRKRFNVLKNDEGSFKCEYCGKEHADYPKLYRHIRYFHLGINKCETCRNDPKFDGRNLCPHTKYVQPRYPCPQCGKEVRKKFMESHMIKYHTPKEDQPQLTCEVCGKVFPTQQYLDMHMHYHKFNKGEREFACETCKRSFYSEDEIKKHVCKHYSCDTCDMKFIRERNLKLHKRSHLGETIFSCMQCEALFEKKKQLNSHKNITHNDRKKYACDLCPKAFKTSSGLKQHILWHRGEKPFKCEICDMTFTTKSHLQSHSLIHTNDYPFSCESCSSRFRDIGLLKKHRERQMCGVSSLDLYKREHQEVEMMTITSISINEN